MGIWFTSDTHYGHFNVISYCDRPFKDVDSMNEYLISSFNSKVAADDIVYHLGDFGLGPKDKWQGLFNRLNGKKHLVYGNHDVGKTKALGWESLQEELYLEIEGKSLWLAHIPPNYIDHVQGRDKKYKRPSQTKDVDIILHGHKHSSPETKLSDNILDVGVDGNRYFPYSLEEVVALCKGDN